MSGVSLFPRVNSTRVAVLYNEDFQSAQGGNDEDAEPPHFWKANAEIAEVAEAIAESLEAAGYTPVLLGVDDTVEDLVARLADVDATAVFNLVESVGGDTHREPEVPICLEQAGIPYTGCGPQIITFAHAKDAARELLRQARVPVPRGITVRDAEEAALHAEELDYFPLFVKPARADGSIGIDQASIVHNLSELFDRLRYLERLVHGPIVVEEYVSGREFNVAIFPEPIDGHLVATEIDFSGYPSGCAPIVTYNCKWEPESPEYCAFSVPAVDRVSPLLYEQLLDVAGRAFIALHGDGYGRVDLRLDGNGTPRVIDVNPNSDLHPEAGLAIAARSKGIDHVTLVDLIMANALSRQKSERTLRVQQRP